MRNCQKSFVFAKQGTDYKSAPAKGRLLKSEALELQPLSFNP